MLANPTIVLASGNIGKIAEIQAMLPAYALRPQADFNVPECPEPACTFVENALLKARNAARHSGLPAIADDSGLAVDALGGAPGVWSARYAGEGASDQANVAKLLAALASVPPAQRTARFICVMVFVEHADDPCPVLAEGVWRGSIAEHAAGNQGFGYDPVFFVPEHGCTAAELASSIKNSLSHRGQAVRKLVDLLHKKY
jgi:XTP/dITP diphosphohydrolase